jgi:hypothetical protein
VCFDTSKLGYGDGSAVAAFKPMLAKFKQLEKIAGYRSPVAGLVRCIVGDTVFVKSIYVAPFSELPLYYWQPATP